MSKLHSMIYVCLSFFFLHFYFSLSRLVCVLCNDVMCIGKIGVAHKQLHIYILRALGVHFMFALTGWILLTNKNDKQEEMDGM